MHYRHPCTCSVPKMSYLPAQTEATWTSVLDCMSSIWNLGEGSEWHAQREMYVHLYTSNGKNLSPILYIWPYYKQDGKIHQFGLILPQITIPIWKQKIIKCAKWTIQPIFAMVGWESIQILNNLTLILICLQTLWYFSLNNVALDAYSLSFLVHSWNIHTSSSSSSSKFWSEQIMCVGTCTCNLVVKIY